MREALELENRRKIYQYISSFPGVYLREIQKALGLPIGVLEYHLTYLEKKGILSTVVEKYRKRYFVKEEIRHGDKGVISLLRQKTPRRIVIHTLLHPKASFKELLRETRLSKSTLSFHLKKLVDGNVLEQEKKGRENIYVVREQEQIARILITYKSSFIDDVVDRFVEIWLQV